LGATVRRENLLWGVILAPVFYYVGLIGGGLLWPGYSHVSQYASELGSAAAPYPMFFNVFAILCGLAAFVGGFGLADGLARLSGRRGWTNAAGITLSLWGVAVIIAGLYPMPNELHGAYGLGMAGQFTPLFALLALRGVEGLGWLRVFLALIFVASLAMFLYMMGVAGPLPRATIGIYQRINSALGIPYLAILGWVVLRHLRGAALPAAK
jgi:hypothetical membrane protein